MKRLICLTLVIMLTCSMYLIADASAVTYVNGSIGSNAIWKKEYSPYVLTGNVMIDSNETLTIEPGVTVDLAGYYIQVNGTLTARGQSVSNIIFTSSSTTGRIEFLGASTAWNEQDTLGCIIENSQFSKIIFIINGSVKISDNKFNSTSGVGFAIIGGSPLIANNIFNLQMTGLTVSSGSPVFSCNTIKGNRYQTGISVSSGGTAAIYDNNISDCQSGIYSSGNTTISRNLIINSVQGIVNYGQSSLIQHNVIAGNTYGIMGIGNIQSNTVVSNSVGI